MVVVLFVLAFGWSVSRGIRKNRSALLLLSKSSKRVKNEIEMVIPVSEVEESASTIHWDDFLKHRRSEARKEKVQIVPSSFIPDNDEFPIHLN